MARLYVMGASALALTASFTVAPGWAAEPGGSFIRADESAALSDHFRKPGEGDSRVVRRASGGEAKEAASAPAEEPGAEVQDDEAETPETAAGEETQTRARFLKAGEKAEGGLIRIERDEGSSGGPLTLKAVQ